MLLKTGTQDYSKNSENNYVAFRFGLQYKYKKVFASRRGNTKITDLDNILYYLWVLQIQKFSSEKEIVKSGRKARIYFTSKTETWKWQKRGHFSHLSMCVETKAFKIKFMNWEIMKPNSCWRDVTKCLPIQLLMIFQILFFCEHYKIIP